MFLPEHNRELRRALGPPFDDDNPLTKELGVKGLAAGTQRTTKGGSIQTDKFSPHISPGMTPTLERGSETSSRPRLASDFASQHDLVLRGFLNAPIFRNQTLLQKASSSGFTRPARASDRWARDAESRRTKSRKDELLSGRSRTDHTPCVRNVPSTQSSRTRLRANPRS